MSLSELSPSVDPAEVGLDPSRLARIDAVLHGYVDRGLLPCTQFLLTRGGEVVHHDVYGMADVAEGRPLTEDTIFRIYSMTKPVTSVALMMLYEQGVVLLEDPVEKHLPAFADARVWVAGNEYTVTTRPVERPMRVIDLLTHTAGLTYGFQHSHAVDGLYRMHGLGDFGLVPAYSNQEMVEVLASVPLQYQPGTEWRYSMATDVCGALVEVLSGQTLGEFFAEHIFDPLGMVDSGFFVDAARKDRLATSYGHDPAGFAPVDPALEDYLNPPAFESGGGGLVSTMTDYHRFTQMLARGGELDGARLLSPRTVAYMTSNHLPGGRLITDLSTGGFSEVLFPGVGFGLGFSINVDPVAGGGLGSAGDYGWGGAASTVFSIDPAEELTMIFLTQLMPSTTFPIRRQLRATVYQALVD